MKNIIQKLSNARTELNNQIREFGNSHTRGIKDTTGEGLGDLLTADVNFRRAGAAAGALVPLAFWYKFGSHVNFEGSNTISKMVFVPMLYGTTYYLSFSASVILGALGYETGKKIDNLTEVR